MFRTASRLALIATTFSCATESPAGAPAREILPNGATLVRYPDPPAIDSVGPEVTEVQVDLQFGSREGDDPNFTFGDIRGIQAASDGTIYVLDYSATEVRAYDPDGRYLRTISRQGEGPGEITAANGIFLAGDTLLWMHDHGKEGSGSYLPIPFQAGEMIVVNPSAGFWRANNAAYRIARTDEGGDTLVVIEAGLPVLPVTDEDRAEYVEGIVEFRGSEVRSDAEEVASILADVKPILARLFVDDEGRLWVKRVTPDDAPAFYDLFSEDGDYLGSVRFGFNPGAGIWIQHGNLYTWVADELGVPYIVRAALSLTLKE